MYNQKCSTGLSQGLWQRIAFIPPPSVCRRRSTKQNLPWLHICFDIFTRLTDSSLVTNVWSLLDVWKFPWIQLVLSKHAATALLSALNKLPIAHICTSPFPTLLSCHRGIRLHLPPWPPVSRNIISPDFLIKAVAKTHGYGKLVVSGFLEQDATWAQHTLPLSIVYCENEEVTRGCERGEEPSLLLPALSAAFLSNPAISDDLVCYSVSFFPTQPRHGSSSIQCRKTLSQVRRYRRGSACVCVRVIIRESKIIHRLWDKKKKGKRELGKWKLSLFRLHSHINLSSHKPLHQDKPCPQPYMSASMLSLKQCRV